MRQVILATIAIVALAACGQTETKAPAAPVATQAFDLHIEIGRYGAMLSQVRGLTAETPAVAAEDLEQPRALAREIRERAWQYNLDRSRLCGQGILPAASCGPSFNPVWLADPADAELSLAELQTRADALGAEVMPFWNAVCEDARSRVTDEEEKRLVCAIE